MKQKKYTFPEWRKFLFLVSCLLFLASVESAFAVIGIDEPLIPCGTEIVTTSGKTSIANPCTFCHFFKLIQNVYNFFVFVIVPPIAVLLVAIGGFFWLSSGGSESRAKKGMGILVAVLWGLVIVYVSWLLISFVLDLAASTITNPLKTGETKATYSPAVWYDPTSWFKLSCEAGP